MLLAFSLLSSTTLLGAAFGTVCILFALYVITNPRGQATAQAGNQSGNSEYVDGLLNIAQQAHTEKLGFLSNFFRAIASRDKKKLDEAILRLRILLEDGFTFGLLMENFLYDQIKINLADPDKRQKLLKFIATNGSVQISVPQAAPPAPPAA